MSLLMKKVLQGIKSLNNNKADKVNITTGVEFKTGRIIDGKEEYGKEINVGYLESGLKEIPHGITGWTRIIKIEGIFYNESSNTTFTIPRSYPSDNARYGIDLSLNSGNILLTCGTNYTGTIFIGIITIYYLKN